MSGTQEGMSPFTFLNALRMTFPQFAERSKKGEGYAQQDAEEAWSQIVQQLKQKLKWQDPAEGETANAASFVDRS
jgi:ubiquitin carboxyl-terminal hydrolase 14